MDGTLGEDNDVSMNGSSGALLEEKANDTANCVTFSMLMETIVGSSHSAKGRKLRPQFTDFHVRSQSATLRFLLQSLFGKDSFYGDDDSKDSAFKQFVTTMLETLAYFKGRSLSREEIDLLDE